MRSVHIERKVREKIFDWLKTIEDEELRKELMDGVIVTGGAIVSMLLDEPVNDYDVYLKSKELAVKVAEYYVAKFKQQPMNVVRYGYTEAATDIRVITTKEGRVMVVVKSAGFAAVGGAEGYQYFETIPDDAEREAAIEGFVTAAVKAGPPEEEEEEEKEPEPYRPIFLTSNAITLSDGIQIVIRFYGKPSEIHSNYDFEHCKSYWRSWAKVGSQLTILKTALLCIVNKRLLYTGSKYPLCSLFRLRKFHARGWTYDLGQVLKMAMQVAELDLQNPYVMMDQLVGMDVAYFMKVMDKIRTDGVKSIDATYLARVVDEIYGEF